MTKNTVKSFMVVLMLIAICLFCISSTYARYISNATGTATAQVAKWAVEVNQTDIVDNDSLTITFNEVENANVVNGKIAPTSKLYADFKIDPAGSEVAIDYSFELGEITASTGDVPTSFSVSKVVTVATDENGVETETEVSKTDGQYTGTIALKDQATALTTNESVTVRVYVEWTNSDANNATDTTVGANAPTLSMDVTAIATQHVD